MTTRAELYAEALRWRRVARGASVAAAVLPLGGWALGRQIGQAELGLLLGGLAGGGAPGLLAAWSLVLARRLERQAREALDVPPEVPGTSDSSANATA